jgi:hypothetical protein
MTYASVRAAAEHLARVGSVTPHQLAALGRLDESLTTEQRQEFTELWRAQGSPAPAPPPAVQGDLANLQSWLTFLTGPEVSRLSRSKISPLTVAEACGMIGCIIVETGRPLLDKLDVVEAGSGAGRGAMQYTAVRRVAYDKARSAAIAKGLDPNSNAWQQQYFAEEYAGLHDPPQGSLIGWTKVFEQRPAGMDPSRAAAHWTAHYFRPGVPHLDRRQTEAQRVWGLVQSGRLSVQQRPVVQLQQQSPTQVTPASPFSALLTPNIRLGEFALGREERRFHHQHQVDTAIELATFIERARAQFGGKPVIITSGYRPAAINRSVGGASGSEHLFNAPDVGAVDWLIQGVSVQAVQDWCDRHWAYSLGYGAPKGFVHLGIRAGRPRVRWNY